MIASQLLLLTMFVVTMAGVVYALVLVSSFSVSHALERWTRARAHPDAIRRRRRAR